MKKNFFNDNRTAFFTDDGKSCIVFEVDGSGEIKLLYSDIPDLSEEELTQLFLLAEREQPVTYSGIKLGFTDREERHWQDVIAQQNVRWQNDINSAELYVIVGSGFSENDRPALERLRERWHKAKIFSADGFEKYLQGQTISAAIDQFMYKLLEYCIFLKEKNYFIWPHTGFYPSWELLNPEVFRQELGVLGAMGYSVGEDKALSADTRHNILSRAYEKNIPIVPGQSPGYMLEWGRPGTAQRLEKIANCLAAFARNAKHRTDSDKLIYCIEKWESDLQYLKQKYYIGNDDRIIHGEDHFKWPGTGGFYGY